MKATLVVFAALAALALAVPEQYSVLYRRGLGDVPRAYRAMDLTQTDDSWKDTTVLTFSIAMRQRNLDVLESRFWEVSNPRHERYAKYMTLEEINDLVGTPAEEKALVLDWIVRVAKSGFDASVLNQLQIVDLADAFRVTAPASLAEALFRTRLHRFTRAGSDHVYVKFLGELSIPTALTSIVELVTGVAEFNPLHQGVRESPRAPHPSNAVATGGCNTIYTMKGLYNVPLSLSVTNPDANQAPYSEQGRKLEGFGASDLRTFQDISGVSRNPISSIIGNDASSYTESGTDLEAALDVQCLTGFGDAAVTRFWVMDSWMYEYSQEIMTNPLSPLVNSISYGWYEKGQCTVDGNCTAEGIPDDQTYVTKTDSNFMKCGLMGFTILAASGDDGVESDRKCDMMRPDFPASSAYVTSVGSTAVVTSTVAYPIGSDAPPICKQSQYDCSCSTSRIEHSTAKGGPGGFDSGGGFSSYLPRPSYQTQAVNDYLNSSVTLPSKQYWNSQNRGYPDVAAIGANVAVVKNGKVIMVGGTSASCPIWGGIITLLNQDRLNAGKAPLGFVNPLLYQMWADDKTIFNDITVGTNGGGCDNLAFDAWPGWDPVSGLGTPNFGKMRAYIANLP